MILIVGISLAVIAVLAIICMVSWRRIVDTNWVHIVQSQKKTKSFGTGQEFGNVYYQTPSFIPVFGVSVIKLPVSNFDLSLHAYKAYDKDRVPFELDVVAFMRIADTNMAAQRVSSFEDLKKQLQAVVQGAVRKILAGHDINTIMVDRATFGVQFTDEVKSELANWGVEPVKNLELMDIRDADGSQVIHNIMAKKTSHIEMESRIEVAKNNKEAKEAEIAAKQSVDIQSQVAEQAVGERRAQQTQAVGVAEEKAKQQVAEEAKTTRAKEMEVIAVGTQRQAEINKNAAIVKAEEVQRTTVINAEAQKDQISLIAQGRLEEAKRDAEGIKARGDAEGAAATALAMAPVNAQIALAEKIEKSEGYQTYLVRIRETEASEAVGKANAEALRAADVKVIANAGNAPSGITSIGDAIGAKGGLQVASFLESLSNTPQGQALASKLFGSPVPTTIKTSPEPVPAPVSTVDETEVETPRVV